MLDRQGAGRQWADSGCGSLFANQIHNLALLTQPAGISKYRASHPWPDADEGGGAVCRVQSSRGLSGPATHWARSGPDPIARCKRHGWRPDPKASLNTRCPPLSSSPGSTPGNSWASLHTGGTPHLWLLRAPRRGPQLITRTLQPEGRGVWGQGHGLMCVAPTPFTGQLYGHRDSK